MYVDEAFIVTDYICESIRFYEKYKNSTEFNDLGAVGKLIDERLKQFMLGAKEAGVKYGTGACDIGDINRSITMKQAYENGMNFTGIINW